jgi:hypothetical protein
VQRARLAQPAGLAQLALARVPLRVPLLPHYRLVQSSRLSEALLLPLPWADWPRRDPSPAAKLPRRPAGKVNVGSEPNSFVRGVAGWCSSYCTAGCNFRLDLWIILRDAGGACPPLVSEYMVLATRRTHGVQVPAVSQGFPNHDRQSGQQAARAHAGLFDPSLPIGRKDDYDQVLEEFASRRDQILGGEMEQVLAQAS